MITRKIGKLLRGKATPFQIGAACVLGGALGFMPLSASAAGGLIVVLTLLLIVLNANLFIAALVLGVAKLLSLALMPLSFQLGQILLDGPTRPLFKWAINTPVLALMDFRYYVTTGGLVLGLVFGVIVALVLNGTLLRFRKTMAKLEEGSDRYKALNAKKSVRFATWLFFGKGHGKKTYEELMSKRIGLPVRPLGVVFAVLVVALLFVSQLLLTDQLLTATLRSQLEQANGATVDLERAEVDLTAGRMTLTGLAMADPNALEVDLLRVAQSDIDLRGADLLSKRIGFDRIELTNVSSGEQRTVPGRRVGKDVTPPDPPEAENEDEKTIDDYIEQAEKWKDRLAQVQDWLERMGSSKPDDGTVDPAAPPGERRETLRERLAREARMHGYASVAANHLVDGAPTVAVYELITNEARVAQLPGETVSLRGENLSSQPWLLDAAPRLVATSSGGTLDVDIMLGDAAKSPTPSAFKVALRNIPGDTIGQQLSVPGGPPISGGTVNVTLDGGFSKTGIGFLDMPLQVSLRDTTISVPGAGSQEVEQLDLAFAVRGPIANPRITVDGDMMADALVQAGASRLAGELEGAIGEEVGEILGDDAADGVGETASDLIGGILGGGKKKGDDEEK